MHGKQLVHSHYSWFVPLHKTQIPPKYSCAGIVQSLKSVFILHTLHNLLLNLLLLFSESWWWVSSLLGTNLCLVRKPRDNAPRIFCEWVAACLSNMAIDLNWPVLWVGWNLQWNSHAGSISCKQHATHKKKTAVTPSMKICMTVQADHALNQWQGVHTPTAEDSIRAGDRRSQWSNTQHGNPVPLSKPQTTDDTRSS